MLQGRLLPICRNFSLIAFRKDKSAANLKKISTRGAKEGINLAFLMIYFAGISIAVRKLKFYNKCFFTDFLSELNVYFDTAENLGKSQQRCVHRCCWARVTS
jgi:hypothetical protein